MNNPLLNILNELKKIDNHDRINVQSDLLHILIHGDEELGISKTITNNQNKCLSRNCEWAFKRRRIVKIFSKGFDFLKGKLGLIGGAVAGFFAVSKAIDFTKGAIDELLI